MLKILAVLGGMFCLAVSLFLSGVVFSVQIAPWLPRGVSGLGAVIAGNVVAALAAAVPFGLAFGAITVRRVAVKSLLFSTGAALLVLLFVASAGSLSGRLWWPEPLECGLFVALFCCFAVVGNLLFVRFPQGVRSSWGTIVFALLAVLFVSSPIYFPSSDAVTPEARLERALATINGAQSENDRFYALNDAAKESFVLGHIEDARKYATELLQMAPRFERDWNYGNAIQDGNIVLGRIAVREGNLEVARRYLLQAGSSRGSPQMDSFGPNMSLAKDLIEKGEREPVLQYFELCRRFWELHNGQLDEWARDVRAGRMPDFGANLIY